MQEQFDIVTGYLRATWLKLGTFSSLLGLFVLLGGLR